MKNYIYYKDEECILKISNFVKKIDKKNLIILCIGTDKCIGDSLGPLVGTFLKESNCTIPVYGTLNYPIHAANLIPRINQIKKNYQECTILIIDACVASPSSKGFLYIKNNGIVPGEALNKNLPMIGDYSIIAAVDSWCNLEILPIHGMRFNLIYELAKIISNGILKGIE